MSKNVFSFRAEYMHDALKVTTQISSKFPDRSMRIVTVQECQFPDVEVEISSDVATIEDARIVMCSMDDAHVMLETLRPVPAKENSFIRANEGYTSTNKEPHNG